MYFIILFFLKLCYINNGDTMGLFKKKEKRIIKNRVTTQYDLSDKKYRYRYKVKGEKQSKWPVVIIIVIVLLIGGFYVYKINYDELFKGINDAEINNPYYNIKAYLLDLNEVEDACIVTTEHNDYTYLERYDGYTAAIYFTDNKIDTRNTDIVDSCTKNLEMGGVIEVFDNTNLANNRNNYLTSIEEADYGYHYHFIYHNFVIRFSNKLDDVDKEFLKDKITKILEQYELDIKESTTK